MCKKRNTLTKRLKDAKTQKSPDKLSVIVNNAGSEKPFVIESSPSDRVIDVKLKIQELEGTPAKLQRLIFCGSPLQNESVLKSCGVVDGSEMHLVSTEEPPITIFVRTITGATVDVRCHENDTVADLKNILNFRGVQVDRSRFIFAGKQLQDGYSLRHYDIKGYSTVHMVVRLVGGFMVNIKISDGRTLFLGSFDTIGELKHKICEKTGIPVLNQALFFNGIALKDNLHREDYNIASSSTIHLVIQE